MSAIHDAGSLRKGGGGFEVMLRSRLREGRSTREEEEEKRGRRKTKKKKKAPLFLSELDAPCSPFAGLGEGRRTVAAASAEEASQGAPPATRRRRSRARGSIVGMRCTIVSVFCFCFSGLERGSLVRSKGSDSMWYE